MQSWIQILNTAIWRRHMSDIFLWQKQELDPGWCSSNHPVILDLVCALLRQTDFLFSYTALLLAIWAVRSCLRCNLLRNAKRISFRSERKKLSYHIRFSVTFVLHKFLPLYQTCGRLMTTWCHCSVCYSSVFGLTYLIHKAIQTRYVKFPC